MDKNLIPTLILHNTLLLNPETDMDKDRKNAMIDSCYFCKNHSSNRDLLEADNASNETFSNDENKEKLMLMSEKIKWILSKDPIKAMELYFGNLEIKNLVSFYGMKNMARLDQYWAFKKRYTQESKDEIQQMRKI